MTTGQETLSSHPLLIHPAADRELNSRKHATSCKIYRLPPGLMALFSRPQTTNPETTCPRNSIS